MKLTKLSSILMVAGVCFFNNTQAQNQAKNGNWCGFDEQIQNYINADPNALEQYFQQREIERSKNSNQTNKSATYTIPVVVHNITHSGGQGYVTKAVIEQAIDRLNIDFNRLNSDTTNTRAIFKPYTGSINIEFRLAHIDPNGDCTEGIVRLEDPSSAGFSDPYKSVSRWPVTGSRRYFNIWLVDAIAGGGGGGTILGYAQFPSPAFGGGIDNTYGVVVIDDAFGPNDRTLTHEIGHCFGLFHTFQSGCGSNCSTSGDGICDTPPALTDTYGCSQTQNSCSNDANGPDPYGTNVVDQIENYMSYDACQNMFSAEQAAEMVSYLNSVSTTAGLAQFNTTSNKANTGVNDPYGPVLCAPIADFNYDKQYICEGASVTFTDMSYNATPTAWNWTFVGGTPSSSTQQNPTITYNTAGTYSATHQPSSAAGNDVITKNNIITVSSLTADYTAPYMDSYENTTQFNNDWRIEDIGGGQTWQITNFASVTGSQSVRVRNHFTNTDGMVDELISPSYDISATSTKTMTFKQAYAKKTAGNTDRLLVYYSTNCGETWQLQLPITAGTLVTAPNTSSEFVPNSSQWATRTVSLSAIGSATNVRFKFEFESGGGSDIYLEDINIGGATGIDEFENIASFNVFPNPTTSSAKITFNLLKDINRLSIVVKNAIGQNVTNVINGQSFNTGKYTLNLDEQRKLSPGIYFIEFNADNNIKVQKLIIQ